MSKRTCEWIIVLQLKKVLPVTLIGLCTHRVDGDRMEHSTVCGVMRFTEPGRCVSAFYDPDIKIKFLGITYGDRVSPAILALDVFRSFRRCTDSGHRGISESPYMNNTLPMMKLRLRIDFRLSSASTPQFLAFPHPNLEC